MDMKCITIATFISNNEYENKEFYKTIDYLKKYFRVDAIIFSNSEIENKNEGIKTLITPKMTKYRRIQILLDEAESNNILCIDNDIEPDRENILNFINKCLEVNYSIAWGKVKAQIILLHGFFFNLLWFPIYLIIFTLIKVNLLLGLFMIALILYLLTEKDIREIIWSIMYMIIFPLVYVVWGISLIYNLIKIYINNKKAKGKRLWTANLINSYKKQKNMLKKES